MAAQKFCLLTEEILIQFKGFLDWLRSALVVKQDKPSRNHILKFRHYAFEFSRIISVRRNMSWEVRFENKARDSHNRFFKTFISSKCNSVFHFRSSVFKCN